MMFKSDDSRVLEALSTSNALVQFDLDGKIIAANENFLRLMGYNFEEIRGRHHSIFVPESQKQSSEYTQFWMDLRSGRHFIAEYERLGKGGHEVWIQGSYNPVMKGGKPYKVVKIATDVTDMVRQRARAKSQLDAINFSQAIIEFTLDGIVTDANANFLKLMGYSLEEVRGKHHRIFVAPEDATSPSYQNFWKDLREGKFQLSQFRRIAKNGREIWIQASYNPILDSHGKVIGIIKFAADISEQRLAQERASKDAMKEVQARVSDVSGLVTSANNQATNIANAVTDVSMNVQAVATGSSQLSSSVSEINNQVIKALEISNNAVSQANNAGLTVESLVEDARKISDVVHLISSIASQTNLLALNATIEAARAGEAGRGFAVVAGEVKNLAAQTARATGEISEHILAVQNSSEGAKAAINAINATINEINSISVSISAAVEQQAAVTSNMSQNMQDAANGVDSIAKGMETVATLTREADEKVQLFSVHTAA